VAHLLDGECPSPKHKSNEGHDSENGGTEKYIVQQDLHIMKT
jgi:hypothetical protein